MYNIGITNYINAYPFHAAFGENVLDPEATLFFDVPTRLNALLREKYLDIALISSFEYLTGDYRFLFPFGIGSCGRIYSVNFYLREDLLLSNTLSCAVTDESATSVNLLKVLAHNFWKKTILLSPIDRNIAFEKNESLLLIGNEALANQHIDGFKTIDLAQAWYEATGLGFVFALFATKKEIGEREKMFCQKLARSLQWAKDNFALILEMAQKSSHHDLSFLRTYYDAHHYVLNEKDLQGLNHFSNLLISKEVYV